MTGPSPKWRFAVDRGGTFTDVVGVDPRGTYHALKLLSQSDDYNEASIEGIRIMLGLNKGEQFPFEDINGIRFGTTVATNALLERKGGNVALITTKGLPDLLEIGYQARPDIFSLCIEKPSILYSHVIEVDERIAADGTIERPLDEEKLREDLKRIEGEQVDAVAIVLMHSWNTPLHELRCEEILNQRGFSKVFPSHRTMNTIKIVSRGQSAVVDAYLSPVLSLYLEEIRKDTGPLRIEFMRSSGVLSEAQRFQGKDSILSGPAGGVVAVAGIARQSGYCTVIGFDMGGTSTDVARYDGEFERIFERKLAGIDLQVEMLNINTVASGGGSVLWFDGQKLRVGPHSAGALPGPACYGFGGPLTVTDANLLTGRTSAEDLPRTFGPGRDGPINGAVTRRKFDEMASVINSSLQGHLSPEEIALGFIRIANEKMALAIKEISVSRGYDVRDYALVCFGGAGGQHACAIASLLDMDTILFHPLGGVLSAYGIGLSSPAEKSVRSVLIRFDSRAHHDVEAIFNDMEGSMLKGRRGAGSHYEMVREIDLRPEGSDTFLTLKYGEHEETIRTFRNRYERVFGYYPEGVPLEVVNLRLEIKEEEGFFPPYAEKRSGREKSAVSRTSRKIFYHDGPFDAAVFIREEIDPEAVIKGPALIVDRFSTLVVDPGFKASMTLTGMIEIRRISRRKDIADKGREESDPVLLEVFNNIFVGIACEMGHTLRNTAHSVNIKERLDFSCALFDGSGNLVSNAPHIPVHLGSMSDTVRALIAERGDKIQPGDVYISNNPYQGGSHLPDITAICPVFSDDEAIIFFTAARGHHADIGGSVPGSIPSFAGHIRDEGVIIDNVLLVRDGRFQDGTLRSIFNDHPHPVRNMQERIADLKAQVASCHKGVSGLKTVIGRYGLDMVVTYMRFIQENAEYSVKRALSLFLQERSSFSASFSDMLDDGSPLTVKISVERGEHPPETVCAVIDFTGTGDQHEHDNLNAPLSVTRSAVLYVVRLITGEDIPLNSGCLNPIDLIVPEGSLINPTYPVPVASGNVETSQRIVDVLMGAFGIAAASQGTMNNLLFEIEGDMPYYETIAGGAGGTEGCKGASGVQVHMTNTRMTDPEVLEHRHPFVRVAEFRLRNWSGGSGKYRGGDGVIRALKFLKPATVTVISERRVSVPYGMEGGGAGKRGENFLKTRDGLLKVLPHRAEIHINEEETIIIKTPGGGGFGKA